MVGGAVKADAPLDPITIDVVSDVVCPWCYIGKRRLEAAIGTLDVPVAVRWRPFQLDPTIPPEGKSRRAYLEGKFGSAERIGTIYRNIAAAGARDGIGFAFDRIAVSPNTIDAHRLVRWAGEAGVQDAVVESLFRAYFIEGRDLGDHQELADIAEAAGMERSAVTEKLQSQRDRAAISAEVADAMRIGVTGVPTFILAGRHGLVGAQPAEEIAKALRTIALAQANSP